MNIQDQKNQVQIWIGYLKHFNEQEITIIRHFIIIISCNIVNDKLNSPMHFILKVKYHDWTLFSVKIKKVGTLLLKQNKRIFTHFSENVHLIRFIYLIDLNQLLITNVTDKYQNIITLQILIFCSVLFRLFVLYIVYVFINMINTDKQEVTIRTAQT